jgi:hypothetical protein
MTVESYHPYLTPQKVSKNPQAFCVYNTLSKGPFGCLRPLGINGMKIFLMLYKNAWILF